jgi:outer membrane receptor for ferrienterochelin and colicins
MIRLPLFWEYPVSASSSRYLALSIAIALCSTAHAAERNMEAQEPDDLASRSFEELMQMRIETVYGASKFEQKVTRAPASVTIVTADEIARFGYRTLGAALRSIRGLYVSDDRNYSYLGTRGFLRPGDYNSRVLVLVDGHRMNDNIYDGAYFGRDASPSLDVVERIEFVRGPSSSIYGSSAFFGIVNVVTKRGADIDGTEITASAGSHGEREGQIVYGQALRNMDLTFNASYYATDGRDRLYYPEFDPAVSSDRRAADSGVVRRRDGEEAAGFGGSVTQGGFTLSASWVSRKKDVPTASFGTVFNAAERTTDERGFIDLKYERTFVPDLQLTGRVAYDRYSYDGDYPYDYTAAGDPPEVTVSRDIALGTWLTSDWQLKRTLSGGHTLIAGVEYRHALHQRQLSYLETIPREYEVQDDRHEGNAALFAQGELSLSRHVLLNVGVRYDEYFDSFGGTLNPRIGVIYSPSDRSAVKLLYGSAFRAPSVYERFYYQPPPDRAELAPEKIRTYELVLERYVGSRDRVNVSLYRYAVTGLVTQQADAEEEIYFDNLTRVAAHGVELELERKFDSGALARVSYALQQTEDAQTHRDLSSSPRHLAKLNLGFPLGGATSAGVELQYQSEVDTLSQGSTRGFLLGNLEISHELKAHGIRLTAAVRNFLDTDYGYPGAEDHAQSVIGLDGRTFSVRLSRRF